MMTDEDDEFENTEMPCNLGVVLYLWLHWKRETFLKK